MLERFGKKCVGRDAGSLFRSLFEESITSQLLMNYSRQIVDNYCAYRLSFKIKEKKLYEFILVEHE